MTLHLLADLEDAYLRFLTRAVENDCVYVLVSPANKGAAVSSNHRTGEDGAPLPVDLAFSDAAFARRVVDRFPGFTLKSAALDEYLRMLGQFGERLVLVNPTPDVAGVEIEPNDLAAALVAVREGRAPSLRYVRDEDGAPARAPAFEDDEPEVDLPFSIVKPWRRDGARVLRHGKARLHVFEGRLEDGTDDVWIRRWRETVPATLPALDDAFDVWRKSLGNGFEIVAVLVARWTPAFVWVCTPGDVHLRMDSESHRVQDDLRALLELMRRWR